MRNIQGNKQVFQLSFILICSIITDDVDIFIHQLTDTVSLRQMMMHWRLHPSTTPWAWMTLNNWVRLILSVTQFKCWEETAIRHTTNTVKISDWMFC